MPYAAKATIEHEFDIDHLNVWLTFRHPMLRTLDPLASPPVYDVMPPLALWLLEVDDVPVDIVASEWQDEFTLLLTSDTVAAYPDEVTLVYDGPNENLKTTWGKQWEPWGAILSTDIASILWIAGMIILWSGAILNIPVGWQLCDGTNGTPNLQNNFIVGAGSTYAVGATGGNLTHTHAATQAAHAHYLVGGAGITGGTVFTPATNSQTPVITVPSVNHLPPYYALCYIMKL